MHKIVNWAPFRREMGAIISKFFRYHMIFHWAMIDINCTINHNPLWIEARVYYVDLQSDLGYPATSGPAHIRISDLAGYERYMLKHSKFSRVKYIW